MMRILLFINVLFIAFAANAQLSPQQRDSINQLTQQDHQLMMKLLGIDALRPGPSGNPDAPNAANTDESKTGSYATLPDPLVMEDGKEVSSLEMWGKRKLEIIEL